MANKYGLNYNLEWIVDPSQKAAKGTRTAAPKYFYEEFTGVASGDVLFIFKLQTKGRFLGLDSLVGALGAGAVKAGGVTIAVGDLVDGTVAGGLDITLTADGTTAAAPKLVAKFLMD